MLWVVEKTYYCVLKGWDTGVFDDFDAFLRATEDYPGAHFRVCSGLSEVEEYLRQKGFDPRMNVYIDGCTLRNGQPDASGGIGVYVAPNHPMNRAEPLMGKCTNQRAELMAAIRGIEEAIKNSKGKHVYGITILTDSEYTFNILTQWLRKWRQNGYRKTNGEPVKNPELVVRLDETAMAYKRMFVRDNPGCLERDGIFLQHVYGHRGNPGNEQADAFARKGALRCRKLLFGY